MTDLHTTKSAAALLGVSEASIRRWSDSGLLAVQRVGRRRARRFRDSDLRAFQGTRTEAAAPEEPAAVVTVGAVRLPLHTHIPTFYDTDAGRLRLSLPLLRDALLAREACLLVADQELAGEYVDALAQAGVDVDGALARRQLEIVPHIGVSVTTALATVEEFFWRASKSGPAVPRLVGEMTSERLAFPSAQDMLDYELGLNALCKRFPCVVLCQYDVRAFDGRTVLGALKAHPDLFGLRLADVLL